MPCCVPPPPGERPGDEEVDGRAFPYHHGHAAGLFFTGQKTSESQESRALLSAELCQTQSLSLTVHQVALWTLGQQVASTGYVVEPYRKYPSLLEVLLNFLKTEQNQGIRREVRTSSLRCCQILHLKPFKRQCDSAFSSTESS